MTRDGDARRGITVTLWSTLSREIVGAMLSMRYDLDQYRQRRRSDALASAETADYSRLAVDPRRPHRGPRLEQPRQHRRVAAPTGVALLVAGGAAGTYLAVAGSLTAITSQPPGTPVAQPVPPATTAMPAANATTPKRAATVRRPDRRPAVPLPAAVVAPTPTTPSAEGAGTPEHTRPPQPTASPSASGSAAPSASASPTSYPSAQPSRRWGQGGRQRAEHTPTATAQPGPTAIPTAPTPAPTATATAPPPGATATPEHAVSSQVTMPATASKPKPRPAPADGTGKSVPAGDSRAGH